MDMPLTLHLVYIPLFISPTDLPLFLDLIYKPLFVFDRYAFISLSDRLTIYSNRYAFISVHKHVHISMNIHRVGTSSSFNKPTTRVCVKTGVIRDVVCVVVV